ncbi:MAG: exopolysaccharide biosynthesis polyprenyl glycosylphosphotransferase [Quisquiliibacterium sp.]
MSGLLVIGLAYAISLILQWAHAATPLFSATVLACAIPYLISANLIYGGVRLPAADQGSMRLLTTALPFLLTPLGFAIFQANYSRGAIVLTFLLTMAWFSLADHLFVKRRFRLLCIDQNAKERLERLLVDAPEQAQRTFEMLPWLPQSNGPSEAETCDGALIDPQAGTSPMRGALLADLKLRHVRLYTPETIAESITGLLTSKTLGDELWQIEGNPAYDLLKRVIDFTLTLLLAPIWLPLLALIALAIRLDSPGPAVFRQHRVGLHGRPFTLVKFRSMRHDPHAPTDFTVHDDPRITRIGRFLRRTHLDELPQLWNVLVGDMSLIGPRPEQTAFVEQFARELPAYPYRHLVRPGLTGWAQVCQGYTASADETLTKLGYDLYYVSNYSLAMDLLICLKTLKVLLTGEGSR